MKRAPLIILFLLACVFRFYHLDQSVTFLGDQGRDLLEIRNSLSNHELPLVGPLTNERIHPGPTYYYLLLPSLVVANFNPMGAVVFMGLLGVFSTLLVYHLGSKFVDKTPAFLSAFLYALSPLIVRETTGIWNPIPVPFFSLLIVYCFWQVQKNRNLAWLVPLGFLTGFAVQFYPPVFLLLLLASGWWIYNFFLLRKSNNLLSFTKWSGVGLMAFAITFVPYFIYQINHNFVDIRNTILFVFERLFVITGPAADQKDPIFVLLLNLLNQQLSLITLSNKLFINLTLLITSAFLILFVNRKNRFWPTFFLLWFLGGIVILTLTPQSAPLHYGSALWIAPFLLSSFVFQILKKRLKTAVLIVCAIFFGLYYFHYYGERREQPNDLNRTKAVTGIVKNKMGKRPFSLLLTAEQHLSDTHYRYFFDLAGMITDKVSPDKPLVVICDKLSCPSAPEITKLSFTDSYCLPVCPLLNDRKIVFLDRWKFVNEEKYEGGKIYFFDPIK